MLGQERLRNLLANSPLFQNVQPEVIATLEPEIGSLTKGALLFQEGDPAPFAYVVESGILGLYAGKLEPSTSFFRKALSGDLVGEYGLLCDQPRSASAVALTDVTYLRFSKSDLEQMLFADHDLQSRFISSLAEAASIGRDPRKPPLHTIVLHNASPGSPLIAEALAGLSKQLLVVGQGRYDLAAVADLEHYSDEEALHEWLTDTIQARELRIVVTRGRSTISERNSVLIDRLLILGDGSAAEAELPTSIEPKAILVRLWPSHQQRCFSQIWSGGDNLRHVVNLRPAEVSHQQRLARLLLRIPNILVLGGGGARGFAHVGALAAMEERAIDDIDMVMGVSIGSLVASLYAFGLTAQEIFEHLERVIIRSKPYQLTFPRDSLFTLANSRREIGNFFSPCLLQDSWLNLQCFSTNLTGNVLHTWKQGNIATAVIASMSVPGIFPPVDDGQGNLHVDGGILNNLPVRAARNLTDGRVIAISLSSSAEPAPPNGQPAPVPARSPSLAAIIIGSMMCASQAETKAQERLADMILKPEIGGYSFLEWKSYRAIYDAGYSYTLEQLRAANSLA